MPCLELKMAAARHPAPVTRLRALLEKPGAAVLHRHSLAEAAAHEEHLLRTRLRVTGVLAVDLNNPPQEPEEQPARAGDEAPPPAPMEGETQDPLTDSFAKGLEIWISDGTRAGRTLVDADEIPGALAMFDSWLRLARYPPAFERLDRRNVGLMYNFREGLTIGVQGHPAERSPDAELSLDTISAISEAPDFRENVFTVRLPDSALPFCHDLLRAAANWLEENSYTNILGSK
jgi:hypothetical protein